jgi:hypothetical protein
LIVTGFNLKQFDITLSEVPAQQLEKHTTWDCGTTYREDAEHGPQNPIIGIVSPCVV